MKEGIAAPKCRVIECDEPAPCFGYCPECRLTLLFVPKGYTQDELDTLIKSPLFLVNTTVSPAQIARAPIHCR